MRNNRSVHEQEQVGLRDRKRAQTRARIEHAAVELVLRDGLEHTTVDAISDRAEVSSRTFFNYFDSKEDAILGLREFDLSAQTVAEHLARHDGADILESIVSLLFTALDPSLLTAKTHASRMEVARRHPDLMARQMAKFMQKVEQVTTAVSTVLAAQPEFRGMSESELAAATEVVMAVCNGATRAVMKDWVASPEDVTGEQLAERAVSLMREVLDKIR